MPSVGGDPTPGTTSADTVLVLAKQPLPGRAKTRLHAAFTPAETATLAAAALSDTLAAVRASRIRRRVLVFDGDPTGWDDGLEVLPQRSGDLAQRLAAAFRDVDAAGLGRPGAAGRDGHPAGDPRAAGVVVGLGRCGARAE